MADEQPQAEERNVAGNLHAIRTRIDSGSNWRVRDLDMMMDGSAYIFYLRSKSMHSFRNALDEVVKQYPFDTSVVLPSELVGRSVDATYDHIIATAKEDLKRAKSCA